MKNYLPTAQNCAGEKCNDQQFIFSAHCSATVSISGADGKVMEEGAALRNRLRRQMWTYETKVVSMESKGAEIKATAEDHAENQTEEAVIIE